MSIQSTDAIFSVRLQTLEGRSSDVLKVDVDRVSDNHEAVTVVLGINEDVGVTVVVEVQSGVDFKTYTLMLFF